MRVVAVRIGKMTEEKMNTHESIRNNSVNIRRLVDPIIHNEIRSQRPY